MKMKGILLLLLVFIPLAQAASFDESLRKITHYAEEYETGNLDYARLVVYTSSVQGELAVSMGATAQGHDAVLTADQLESALGAPQEHTKWVWVEGEEREKKVDEVPAWRKLVFDGNIIQVWLGAWPNILVKEGRDVFFYRLQVDVQFKEAAEDAPDFGDEIERIRSLAEAYNAEPGRNALERLAEESVSVEQRFNMQFNQNPAQCNAIMNTLFGSEYKRESQQMLVEEITFFEGERAEAIMRLELCEDCSWRWINLNMWIEARGGFAPRDEPPSENRERFKGLRSEAYEEQTRQLLEDIRRELDAGNFDAAQSKANDLRMLTEAWNEAANDVWKQFEGKFQVDFASMTPEEQETCARTYCWIKKNQERAHAEQALRASNYDARKRFYLSLFEPYEKKTLHFTQEQWEKRLLETFFEAGEEVCDNNRDDNDDSQIDCGDAQCGGKICGYETAVSDVEGIPSTEQVPLYCIASTCQRREEIVAADVPVCGNNLCELGEAASGDVAGTCVQDCTQCAGFEPPVCEGGSVVFSGEDANGCPLAPVCVASETTCVADSDCVQPLCGTASCVEGICRTAALSECRTAECIVGEERQQACSDGSHITNALCELGVWIDTGVQCAEGTVIVEDVESIDELLGDACAVREDCGGEHDVCSNGQCVALVDAREIVDVPDDVLADETPENEETETDFSDEGTGREETSYENSPEESASSNSDVASTEGITGQVISFFRERFTGRTIDGEGVVGGSGGGMTEGGNEERSGESGASGDAGLVPSGETGLSPDELLDTREQEEDEREQEREEHERENQERRESECRERCDRECYDREVRPSVEKCIFEECGDSFECDIDEVRVRCESGAGDVSSCTSSCFDTCLKGEDTWIEPEREERMMEKFVFTVGGSCREVKGRDEGSLWFGGWGEGFNDFHLVKNNYYSGDGGDWCARDLRNLLRQREELERSLNEQFAAWFFEQYVANAAADWQNHLSGIFNLYWRDVDISRQIAERQRCLGQSEASPHELITFKYETDFGSIEFWEELRSTKLEGFDQEVPLISPYMRLWLFPSRDFFRYEMRQAMEQRRMPGPAEKQVEKQNGGLSAEERAQLRDDAEFMDFVRTFNSEHGDELLVQFKDDATGEIAFNIYIRMNEAEVIYFEPRLPEESPPVDVTVTFDVEKLLDIIEFGESGRVELQSPPWDRRPPEGVVGGVVNGVQMYLKFRALMGSIEVVPASAESDTTDFMREFLRSMMEGDERGPDEEEREGEGSGPDEEFPEGFDDEARGER